MSVRTKAHHTKPIKSERGRAKIQARKKKTPWREIAKKEIGRFSEAGVMLRGCRYKKDITQLELSKAIGVNQHHISEMENGKRPIGKEMAKRLADFFETDYRVFL
jgi:DNA-binding XRE family transcriptional regulator